MKDSSPAGPNSLRSAHYHSCDRCAIGVVGPCDLRPDAHPDASLCTECRDLGPDEALDRLAALFRRLDAYGHSLSCPRRKHAACGVATGDTAWVCEEGSAIPACRTLACTCERNENVAAVRALLELRKVELAGDARPRRAARARGPTPPAPSSEAPTPAGSLFPQYRVTMRPIHQPDGPHATVLATGRTRGHAARVATARNPQWKVVVVERTNQRSTTEEPKR